MQIKIRAGLRADSTGYFAPEATPTMATTIGVRAEPVAEPALLERADAHEPVAGYLFRRPAGVAAPAWSSNWASCWAWRRAATR